MSKQNHQAIQAELRDFLSQMRGKSPKEMLGAVASSNLLQSTMVATAAIVAALVLLTLIPFGLNQLSGGGDPIGQPVAEEAEPEDAALTTPPEPEFDADGNTDPAQVLGIGEAESAPENVNPLESSTDDLLDGLE